MEEQELILEVHWYSSGLRHTPICAGDVRPSWAPPADWVGLRDGETLQPGSYAVELCRSTYNGARASWIAVYKPSIDLKFGDRGNHAGVGVWTRNKNVVFGAQLLNGLKALVDEISNGIARGEEPSHLQHQLTVFLESFAPKYFGEAASLPDRLSGLRYGGQLPETVRFSSSGEMAWRDAGERVEALPFVSPGNASRALIYLDSDENGGSAARPDGAMRELLAALPEAWASELAANTAAQRKIADLERQVSSLAADLDQQKRTLSTVSDREQTLNDRIKQQDQEIASYDADYNPRIKNALSGLQSSANHLEGRIERLHKKIDEIPIYRPERPQQIDLNTREESIDWLQLFMLLVVFIAVALFGYGIYSTSDKLDALININQQALQENQESVSQKTPELYAPPGQSDQNNPSRDGESPTAGAKIGDS